MSERLTESDCAGLSALLCEALPHHPVPERWVRKKLFGAAGFDPALALCRRGQGGRLLSAVAALPLADEEGRRRARLSLAATGVAERGRGLARGLYAEVETELRRRGVQDVVANGAVVEPGIDLRYTAAVTMLMRRLYAPAGVAYDMTFDPRRPPPPPPDPPSGFRLARLEPEDAPALDALCARDFPDWRNVSGLIRPGEPCGVLGVFSSDGALAAFTAYDEYILGPVGTAVPFRRRGLGSVAFLAAVREAARAWPGLPLLISRANMSYYARAFGCVVRGTVWQMKKDLTQDPAVSKGK